MSEQSNRGGMLRYRCRMCGEEYENVHVPDVWKAVLAIVLGSPEPWPGGAPLPSLVDPHYHEDGSGVADLIGGIVDKEAS